MRRPPRPPSPWALPRRGTQRGAGRARVGAEAGCDERGPTSASLRRLDRNRRGHGADSRHSCDCEPGVFEESCDRRPFSALGFITQALDLRVPEHPGPVLTLDLLTQHAPPRPDGTSATRASPADAPRCSTPEAQPPRGLLAPGRVRNSRLVERAERSSSQSTLRRAFGPLQNQGLP